MKQPAANPLLTAALAYAKRQWPVIPVHSMAEGRCTCGKSDCGSPAKHPRTEHGLTDASTNIERITSWWTTWPDANVGVITGKQSRIVVLDCDAKSGGPDRIRELMDINGAITTLTSITGGGGQHWVFQAPPEPLRNTAGVIAPGIDTRAEGGYIVAPPSIHLSGRKYEWDNRVAIQAIPPWLLLLWPSHTASPPATNGATSHADAPMWVSQALQGGAPNHQRNATATRLIGYFHSKGIPRDVILATVQPFAEKCQPPMELPELQRTLNSVTSYQAHLREADVTDPPEFEERANTLIYTWPSPGITITVDQLRRNNLGLQSEIIISGEGRTIHGPVHYNMTSTSGRETLVKYLNKRMETDWPAILESLSRLTVAHSRSGDPVSNLKDYLWRPGTQWVLRPFILDGQPTILFGAGGLGKSILALAMMLALESHKPVLPGTAPESGHHGLYLDWEDTEYQHGERYRQLCAGSTLDPANYALYHLRCAGPISDQAQRIHHQIAESNATFLVIDSAGMACGGEPEKSEAALMFFAALRTFRVPALIIAHQTKQASRGLPFGSVMWHNAARMTWEIASKQRFGRDGLNVALTNRKSNVSALLGTIGFSILWGNETIQIKAFDTRTEPDFVEPDHLAGELYNELVASGGGMTTQELAKALGGTSEPDTLRKTMKREPTIFRVDESEPRRHRWYIIEALPDNIPDK